MTDYTELVKALRCQFYGDQECADNCPYCGDGCMPATCAMDAAAAIEALDSLLDQNTQRCEELRKQLREAHESYERHLNELEAQLPKRGEWKSSYPEIEPNPMFMYGICSICGFEQGISNKLNYCPNCGARMNGEQNVE